MRRVRTSVMMQVSGQESLASELSDQTAIQMSRFIIQSSHPIERNKTPLVQRRMAVIVVQRSNATTLRKTMKTPFGFGPIGWAVTPGGGTPGLPVAAKKAAKSLYVVVVANAIVADDIVVMADDIVGMTDEEIK